MKKIISTVVVIAVLGVIAYYASTAKAPAVEQDQTPAVTDTDTAAAINASIDSIELADPSVDLNALDADINAL